MSFRRRVVLLSAAAVAIAIVFASSAIFFAVRSQLRDQVDDELRAAAGQISFRAPPPGTDLQSPLEQNVLVVPAADDAPTSANPGHEEHGTVAPAPEVSTRRSKETLVLPAGPLGGPEVYAQLVSSEGDVLRPADSTLRLPAEASVQAVAEGKREPFFSDIEVGGTHLRTYTAQLGAGQAVQAAKPLEDVDATLNNLLIILVLVSGGGVALASGLGVVVSRGALAPVARLSRVAQEVAETRDLSRRIEERGDDDLADLADSFNRMLTELERSVEAQRQLVADASHELRTPLTSLRTNVELLGRTSGLAPEERQRLIADVVEQLDELTVLVGDLVDLARYAEQDAERNPLRLDHLVEDMVERAQRYAPGLAFEVTTEPCLVRGDQGALERATLNLLDNAAKWSPPAGRVEVHVSKDGTVSVRDHGPGIAEDDLPRVFDRFYRASAARELPGSGLGLAIVRQVAESHAGWVVASSRPGAGSVLRLWLPPLASGEQLSRSS